MRPAKIAFSKLLFYMFGRTPRSPAPRSPAHDLGDLLLEALGSKHEAPFAVELNSSPPTEHEKVVALKTGAAFSDVHHRGGNGQERRKALSGYTAQPYTV
jgi:hypothetical protein